ncbi:MAG: stalk domain-containing protein [Anaerovoracaceae bacterium]
MKKKNILTAGIAIGLFLSMGIQVFAAGAIEKIEAYVNHQMNFTFDGESKVLPDDYEVIVYKDRSYVPVRFIAENLGAEVEWNNETKNISITSPKSTSTDEPTSSTEEMPKYDYRKLPLYNENSNFKMSVTLFTDDDYGKKLNVTLENKTDNPIQLDQMSTVVEVNGVEHSMKKASISNLDTRWYKDIAKEEKTEGYVRLPNDIDYDDLKNLHVVFKVKTNGSYTEKVEDMEFNIAL